MLYWVHLALSGFELTTLVLIGTDCTGCYKSNIIICELSLVMTKRKICVLTKHVSKVTGKKLSISVYFSFCVKNISWIYRKEGYGCKSQKETKCAIIKWAYIVPRNMKDYPTLQFRQKLK